MSQSSVLTLRISEDLKNQLALLAKTTGRKQSFLATQALKDILEIHAWQVKETQKALLEADQRKFASKQAVRNFFKKWDIIVN